MSCIFFAHSSFEKMYFSTIQLRNNSFSQRRRIVNSRVKDKNAFPDNWTEDIVARWVSEGVGGPQPLVPAIRTENVNWIVSRAERWNCNIPLFASWLTFAAVSLTAVSNANLIRSYSRWIVVPSTVVLCAGTPPYCFCLMFNKNKLHYLWQTDCMSKLNVRLSSV